MRYDGFTVDDEKRFLELTKKGMTAIFIYTNRLIHNGENTVYNEDDISERAIAIGGDVYAPVSLFTKFIGAEYKKRCGKVTLTLGDKSFSCKDSAKVGYLPVEEACAALGLASKKFCENKFLIIGNEEDLLELAKDEVLVTAGSYVVFGDYEPEKFTAEDYELVAKRYHDKLVGNEEIIDLNNPNVQKKLETVNANCAEALAGLDRSGDPIVLWGDKPLHDTDDGDKQYRRIVWLARGYETYGSAYYHKKEVLDDIIYALDWMYRHAFGEDLIAGHGWRDPKLPNWWHWFVGSPEMLTDILFILYKEISLEERKRYLKAFVWITTWMCTDAHWYMSRLKVCTKYGILLHEPSFLKKEQEDFDKTIEIKRPDYLDYSHQYPHNISYGAVIPERALFVAALLSGTPLEYISPSTYSLFYLVKYMFDPAMYKGQGMFMLGGRHTRQMVEINAGASLLSKHLDMLGMFGEDEDKVIKSFIKRHSITEQMRNAVISSASFYNLAKYEEILADDSIPYDVEIEYAHAWYTGDRAAQHRNNYAFGIAMASCRHINYESILLQNQNGWYTGDGAFHLYTSYDNNQYDGVNFMQNMNIAYRFPGTTEDMQERAVRGIGYNPWKAPNTYAGSMELYNKYIVAGMDFVSEYCDEDLGQYDEVRGWSRAVHKNDLVAKKAWFCFEDEAVLLGAGITSTMDSPVNTIAAHRRIVKDDEFTQTIGTKDGTLSVPRAEYEERFENPRYFNWAGHAGYVFLDKTDLLVNRYNYTTDREQPYLELRIEHGKNPTGATYAFAVLPYATNEKLEEYSKNPDVEIVSNTVELQAVRDNTLGITGYVFYKAGKCESVEVDRGAIVFLADKDGAVDFSVCQPDHGVEELTVKLFGDLKITTLADRAEATEIDGGYEIKINCAGAMGAPYKFSFAKK